MEFQGTNRVVGKRWSTVVNGFETASLTVPASTSVSAQHKTLNSPTRGVVRVAVYAGEATALDVKHSIDCKFERDGLPHNWRVLTCDVLAHDSDVEKTDGDTWVLRTQASEELYPRNQAISVAELLTATIGICRARP